MKNFFLIGSFFLTLNTFALSLVDLAGHWETANGQVLIIKSSETNILFDDQSLNPPLPEILCFNTLLTNHTIVARNSDNESFALKVSIDEPNNQTVVDIRKGADLYQPFIDRQLILIKLVEPTKMQLQVSEPFNPNQSPKFAQPFELTKSLI